MLLFFCACLLVPLHATDDKEIDFELQTQPTVAKECYQINGITIFLGMGLCYVIYRMYKIQNLYDELTQNKKYIQSLQDIDDALGQQKIAIANLNEITAAHTRAVMNSDYTEFNGALEQSHKKIRQLQEALRQKSRS